MEITFSNTNNNSTRLHYWKFITDDANPGKAIALDEDGMSQNQIQITAKLF